jgi:HK97 family phage major capsid protein
MNKEMKKVFRNLLFQKTAMASDTDLYVDDSTGENYLPKPIADEIIKEVYERNIARQLFRTINVPGKTLSIPSVAYDDENIYQVGTGVGTSDAIGDDDTKQLEYSTSAVVLKPGKLAAKAEVPNDDINDANLDVVGLILEAFGEAFARAEEKAMLSATAQDASSSSYTSIVEGLFYSATDAQKNTDTITINASNDYGMSDGISEGIKELGVHARGDVILICSDKFAHYLRTDRGVKNDVFGSAGIVQNGILPKIYGVSVYSSSYVDAIDPNKAILIPKSEPLIGQGRGMQIRRKEDIERDSQIFIAFERFDFTLRHMTNSKYDAIVRLDITAS